MKHPEQLTQAELAAVVQELYAPLLLYARQLCSWPEDAVQEAFWSYRKPPCATRAIGVAMGRVRVKPGKVP